MFRIWLAALFLASFASHCNAAETDFQKLAPTLNDFRRGAGVNIAIRIAADSFQVLHLSETELTADQARALLPKEPAFPALKFSENGNWIEHTAGPDLTLEEPITASGAPDATRLWKRRTWESLSAFDRSAWPKFVEFAIANGLCGVEETRYKGRSSFVLSFAPLMPDYVEAGDKRLSLNAEFGSVMRLSPKYPPKTGTKGFVILLHDPHENVAGRFQTLIGLRSLISENSSVKFRFLVEGAYAGSRKVGFSGLDAVIKPNADTSTAIVHRLLARYLINTPMAYRLLYDRKMSTDAIDNNTLLTYPAPRPIRPFMQQVNSVQNISDALEKAHMPTGSQANKSALLRALNMAFIYLEADLRDAPDSELVDYHETIAKLYRSIAQIGQRFSEAGVALSPGDLQSLTSDANGYLDQADIYKRALGRNQTMAPLILEAAMSAEQELPITFIGNYHTHGILPELEKAQVGYVVIEPRPRIRSSETEQKAFERANHSNTRDAYLSTALLNMGWNGPTLAEVKTVYAPKIAAKIPQIRTEQIAADSEFKAIPGAKVDVEQLRAAVGMNGSLAAVKIGSGANMPPPPGNFGKAFAYFDAGGGGGRGSGGPPRFTIADPTDPRWKDNDRYGLLAVALFTLPERSNQVSVGTNIMFYPDPVSNRLFLTFYEPNSKRIYCFEGDPQQAASLVPLPIGGTNEEQNVRTQIVKVIMFSRKSKNG